MIAPRVPAPRVLIVGAGHGCRVHRPALIAAGFDVVGLVGSDAGRSEAAAAKNGIPAAFTDLDTAIAATGAAAVTIASPPATHAGLVLTAARRRCHVLCEKPFARDAGEARRLRDAAQEAGIVHVMGNQMRMLPERITIARAIADGTIGAPRFFSFVQYVDLVARTDARRPGWWFDVDAGGGWLGASGSHLIDMARMWLGDFAGVSAALSITSDRSAVAEDSYVARCTMANGAEGVLQQTGGAWGRPIATLRIAGTHGTLWTEAGTAWIADKDGTRTLEPPADAALAPMEPSGDPKTPYLHIELPPTIAMMTAWRSAIEGAPDSRRYADFTDGLAAMAVMDAMRRSAAEDGRTIAVDPVD